MGSVTRLAFVVTCKGRLHHLRQSLPLLASQPECECVVVDYDCPDRTHAWVAENFPAVRVVHVSDAPRFNIARARNLGAQAASAPWLCFVDADILVAENFAATLLPMLRPGHYFRPLPMSWEKWGTHLCLHADFQRAGGYDEVIEGWGGEDDDLYRRLEALGCRPASFPGQLVTAIAHDDAERTRHYDIRDKWTSQRINAFYLQLKYDIGRQTGMAALTLPARQALYAEVRRSVLQDVARGAATSRFEVTLPEAGEIPLAPGWHLQRRWVYEMTGAAAAVPPPASLAAAADAYFAAHPVAKLHLGCGDHLLDGWLNTDAAPRVAGVAALDAARPLPFADASFDYVFSEHLLEHMPYPQGCAMLAECRRVLKPGGVMRLATPDLAFLVDLYRPDKSELQLAYLAWSKQCFLPWAPSADDTFVINNAVRDWGHCFIYDEKVLRHALAQAGFSAVVRCRLMASTVAALAGLENEARTPPGLLALETMVFEAVRP